MTRTTTRRMPRPGVVARVWGLSSPRVAAPVRREASWLPIGAPLRVCAGQQHRVDSQPLQPGSSRCTSAGARSRCQPGARPSARRRGAAARKAIEGALVVEIDVRQPFGRGSRVARATRPPPAGADRHVGYAESPEELADQQCREVRSVADDDGGLIGAECRQSVECGAYSCAPGPRRARRGLRFRARPANGRSPAAPDRPPGRPRPAPEPPPPRRCPRAGPSIGLRVHPAGGCAPRTRARRPGARSRPRRSPRHHHRCVGGDRSLGGLVGIGRLPRRPPRRSSSRGRARCGDSARPVPRNRAVPRHEQVGELVYEHVVDHPRRHAPAAVTTAGSTRLQACTTPSGWPGCRPSARWSAARGRRG